MPQFHLIFGSGNFVERQRWIVWNYAETVPFHKISTPGWNYGILRSAPLQEVNKNIHNK